MDKELGYKKLEIYKLGYELSLSVHTMSLRFPKFELHEESSQIRRSAKSICANIVEGRALRKYKNEYVHYLYCAYGSSEETRFHLDELFNSGPLADKTLFNDLRSGYERLSAMIFAFIQSVGRNDDTPMYLKENEEMYVTRSDNESLVESQKI